MTMTLSPTKSKSIEEIAATLKILADPTRLRIFNLLMSGERCNCEMGGLLGLAPNLISHHLGILRNSGLIDARRDTSDARWIYYSVNREALSDVGELLSAFLSPSRIPVVAPQCCSPASADTFPASQPKPATRPASNRSR